MNRTFQGRITPGMVLIFILLLSITFYFGWYKNILAIPLIIIVIFMIERMLHTTFTVTSSGLLIIHKGRFSNDIDISISDIAKIEKGTSLYSKLGVYAYLNIILKNGKEISVWPADEKSFLEWIQKVNYKNIVNKE